MNTKRLYQIIVALLLTLSGMEAQERNRLYIPDVTVEAGKDFQLPVYVQNTSVNITAVQFTLKAPEGVDVSQWKNSKLTDRTNGHKVAVSDKSENTWTIMVYSTTNQTIRGNAGIVLNLPSKIDASVAEGTSLELEISRVVLSDSLGRNVLTDFEAGNILVKKTPDFTATDVTCNVSILNPTDTVDISWTVNNIGTEASTGGWSERVSLISESGENKLLTTTYYNDGTLAGNSSVKRKARVPIPRLLGLDGSAHINIEIVPNSDSGERDVNRGNNIAESSILTVNKRIFVTIPERVNEPLSQVRVGIKVERSGSWKEQVPVSLTIVGDNRVATTASGTLRPNTSSVTIYMEVSANNILDNDSIFAATVAVEGYDDVTYPFVVVDDELPQLTLSTSKSEVNEGETFRLTITNQRAPHEPLTIKLESEMPTRIKVPEAVVMPAGDTSIAVDIEAVEDEDVTDTLSIGIQASADMHVSGETVVLLADNDMPDLTLTLRPDIISEGDGLSSIVGKIRRTTNVDKKVTIVLSDDGEGVLYYPSQRIEMPSGVAEIEFTMGTIDNTIVDGNRTYTVTAAVYIPLCSCSAKGNSVGSVTQTLTVTDDDGPTLKVRAASTSFREGARGTLTIFRNTSTAEALTVYLSSDSDESLEYDHDVTIPTGKSSVDIQVLVRRNEIADDSRTVVFTVEHADFTKGTCWVNVADQTLPDVSFKSLEITPEYFEAGQSATVHLTLQNTGFASLQSETRINVYFDNRLITYLQTYGSLPADGETALEHTFTLPTLIGEHTIYATVNETKSVRELMYSNNNSEKIQISTKPSFTATAVVDKNECFSGDTVTISGVLTGRNVANAKVEVYVLNDGNRQSLTAITDADGKYAAKYIPMANQSGTFIVGACFPGENLVTEMTRFEKYGMILSSSRQDCEFTIGEKYTGSITITNPMGKPLTGVRIQDTASTENCAFTFSLPETIPAGGSVKLSYEISAEAISEGTSWQVKPITILCNEGAKAECIINYYVQSQRAKLIADVTHINTTMTKDVTRDYPIKITNIGKGETGIITLALPEWMTTATPRNIASLTQGESTKVLLRFLPSDDMVLNIPVTGHFGINCANGDGLPIDFTITPVSETKGTLKVDVVDELTFYTDEAPHVADANVEVRNPATGLVVVRGNTDGTGVYSTSLPEGSYEIRVSADKHESYIQQVIVDPGIETLHEAFISCEAVTYSWEVKETQIEDSYVIETVADYDVSVPKPILCISLPDEQPELNKVFPIVITNKGLIAVSNVNVALSCNNSYEIHFLNEPYLTKLAPQQTEIVYAKFLAGNNVKGERRLPGPSCVTLAAQAVGDYICANYPRIVSGETNRQWGRCNPPVGGGGGLNVVTTWPWYGNYVPYTGPTFFGDLGYYGPNWGQDLPPTTWPDLICGPDPEDDPENDPSGIPVGRPEIPSSNSPVVEEPCNFDSNPVFYYKLVPVSGTRYEMKGVAADGVSQVKLVLDTQRSRVPQKDCYVYSDFRWKLSKELGTIEGDSYEEAIYTAPNSYPEETGTSITIEATMWYNKKKSDFGSEDKKATPVKIEIIRPPVVYIHGLGSNSNCFAQLDEHLQASMYKPNINYRMEYARTNASRFAVNYPKVGNAIKCAQRRALNQGYVAKKCDLVAHSMGGTLARLYVQLGGNRNEINRIITLNTPHAGSEIGDAVWAHRDLARNLSRIFYRHIDVDAIRDLGVEAEATAELNSFTGSLDIPVCAIATQVEDVDLVYSTFGDLVNEVSGNLLKRDFIMGLFGCMGSVLGHILNDDLPQISPQSDGVVSVESQYGGCEATRLINGPLHIGSPDNAAVIQTIEELLARKTDDPAFSRNWFHPTRRTFDHEDWERYVMLGIGVDVLPLDDNISNLLHEQIDFAKEHHVKPLRNIHENSNRTLHVHYDPIEGYSSPLVVIEYGSEDSYIFKELDFTCPVPSTFSGTVQVTLIMKDSNDQIVYHSSQAEVDTPEATPVSISAEEVFTEVGESETLRIDCTWSDGSVTTVNADDVTFDSEGYATFDDNMITGVKQGIATVTISSHGLVCSTFVHIFASESIKYDEEDDEESSDAVCSSVSLSFKQQMVLTRQAFRGTLTVNNGSKSDAMTDVKLNLQVKDADGNVATAHELQINAETIDGFNGQLDLTAGWRLGADSTGVATILFIPTKYAAETEAKEWSFGGTFSYTDPTTGLVVTRNLNPVTLTVSPTPNLEMNYFVQRDMMGDDALTEDIVEPMVPAEFSVLISNRGYGDANNVRMVTNQPEIIDNEKGLLINFELLSSQLNGGDKTLALGQNVATEFGTIPAQSSSYAQWWMQSSLLGHFTKYDVSATHVTSYGNPDLSLLDTVVVHELIHTLTLPMSIEGQKRAVGFLVNDEPDANDRPDRLFLSDGTVHAVSTSSATLTEAGSNHWTLTVTPSAAGWNYGSVVDPTAGRKLLAGITRDIDGATIDLANFWQTDRTLRDNKDPLYEFRLHFADEMPSQTVTYTLLFEDKPMTVLSVDSIIAADADVTKLVTTPIEHVRVYFNKPVAESTFTTEALTLVHEAQSKDVTSIGISRLSDKIFELELSELTAPNGYYVLTVQTSAIKDKEGFCGESGRSISWHQLKDGITRLVIGVVPDGSGTAVASSQAVVGETVTLTATPADGFCFDAWLVGGEIVGTDPSYVYVVSSDLDIVARFSQIGTDIEKQRDTSAISGAVYDITGRRVYNRHLKPGIYIVDGQKRSIGK